MDIMPFRLLPFLLENGWDVAMVYPLYPVIEDMAKTINGSRLKFLAKVRFGGLTTLMCTL